VKRPRVVESTFATPIQRMLDWQLTGQYHFFDLDGYRFQLGPRGTCTTAPVRYPRRTVDHAGLVEALTQLGWKIVE